MTGRMPTVTYELDATYSVTRAFPNEGTAAQRWSASDPSAKEFVQFYFTLPLGGSRSEPKRAHAGRADAARRFGSMRCPSPKARPSPSTLPEGG